MKIATLDTLETEQVNEITTFADSEIEDETQTASINQINTEHKDVTETQLPEHLQKLWEESKQELDESQQK